MERGCNCASPFFCFVKQKVFLVPKGIAILTFISDCRRWQAKSLILSGMFEMT